MVSNGKMQHGLPNESMRSNQLELDRVSQNPLMNRTVAGWPDLVFWVISGDDIRYLEM